jgi:steroid delta-isomerase-like uncharacterized protein
MNNPNIESSRRWFEEVWNQRRSATIDEMLTPESLGHLESGDVRGAEAFKPIHADFLAAFPDLHVSVEAVIADGDDVVVRWRATGTHAGDGLGFKATQEAVVLRGMSWHRYRDGKLIEGWDAWNLTALHEQLRSADRRRQEAQGQPV